MIDQYKAFFTSQEILDFTPYSESILNDDVDAFKKAFEPFVDEEAMIDPIELCAAFGSENIFEHLITTYDYSDFYNPFHLTLPMVLIVFERDNFLFEALERIPFHPEQFAMMYDFMLQTKEPEYFIQFYKAYGIDSKYRRELLKNTMVHSQAFEYLIAQKSFKKFLKDGEIIHEIIGYNQAFIHHLAFIEDLTPYLEIVSLIPVLQLEDETLFHHTLDFLLKRKLDLNKLNEYGLNFFHVALRHAFKPSYVYYILSKGADPFIRTSRGYPSSHQLLFRNAEFTLEMLQIIDIDAKDLFGLTLKDYDEIQRRSKLQLLDILLITKLVLNMDESAIYELDNAEYYDLATIHGIEPFINAYSVIIFERSHIKRRFIEHFDKKIYVEEVGALKHSLENDFPHDELVTLELVDDVIALEDDDFEMLSHFAIDNKSTLKILTDGVEINRVGTIDITIHADGSIDKKAGIHSNYIDAYYIHTFYDIPLENITYTPRVSNKQRFLN